MKRISSILVVTFLFALSGFAQSSLTDEQIKAYRDGSGMGMAIPAEVNGFPGPRHVLDLADRLDLTADQRARMKAVYDAMHVKAVKVGAAILELERTLDSGFADGTMNAGRLENLTRTLGERTGELRRVHLEAHLAARTILTPAQIAAYATLRGHH